jgi:hypothetical protein
MLLGPDDGILCRVVAKLLIRRLTSFFISKPFFFDVLMNENA